MKRFSLLILALAISACSNGKSVTEVDTRQSHLASTQVTAERVATGVRVTNGGGVEIRFLVKNAHWLGLLAGCHNEPSTCATLGAGESAVVKSEDIYGYSPSGNALEVWYWVKGVNDPAGKSIQLD